MQSVRHLLVVMVTMLAFAGLAVPGVAMAQDYDLSFSLPTYGKSGCMVCHGDRNLVGLKGGQSISYWIDDSVIQESAHAGIMCTGCHMDFSYKSPHIEVGEDWRETAKLACKNCHLDAYTAYSLGVHSTSGKPGEEPNPDAPAKPLCGDCHGAHAIRTLTDEPRAQAELHARGREICGDCHEDEWESYDDYYHGAAYKTGAPDAPACWTCHDSHMILPSSDRRSLVAPVQLGSTCGACHYGVDEGYLTYTELIHNREQALAENPLYLLIIKIRDSISGLLAGLFGVTAFALVE